MLFLGIDTSCYTTSCAVVDETGRVLCDNRRFLRVEQGQRGLRQSDMVFQHIKNLPELLPEGFCGFTAVAASAAPRPTEDSYMPVFLVSDAAGRTAAAACGAAYYPLTHQHGHIGAALIGNTLPERFAALHVSGGTTECMLVEKETGGDRILRIERLGGSDDIAAGQLVDRIGQQMGLEFPIGPKLETLARSAAGELPLLKSSVRGLSASFSGAEAQAKRLLEAGCPPQQVARATELCVARALEKLARRAMEQTGAPETLFFGGVMSNKTIRERLEARLKGRAVFGAPAYCADNACGLAMQAREHFLANGGET